ncbi:MAG: pantetheine-phosphate adenylyltransferase [Bacteriovoracaceae bacterium]|nr:pantetheine-phosphate adenylyltransferase [Bacteriovoracaceae bacterium]
MKKAIYAGTFDPFTIGHLDIVNRALGLFDELTVLVAVPPQKTPFISAKDRLKLLNELFSKEKKIKVDSWDGLIVDYAREHKIPYLVRGLRPTGDFDSEFQMASMNSRLNDKLDTVFLVTGENLYYISSSLVKEIYSHNGDIKPFVPANIAKYLKDKKGK